MRRSSTRTSTFKNFRTQVRADEEHLHKIINSVNSHEDQDTNAPRGYKNDHAQ